MEHEETPLEDAAIVHCPYCGEPVEVLLDTGGGDRQDYIEDCEVCCRPWQVSVQYHAGMPTVNVTRAD